MLRKLGVSSSGYYSWKKRKISIQERKRKERKERIQTIYDDSHRIYGAPKITKILQQEGECISERTVGFYMNQLGIHACWVKHYAVAPSSCTFDEELQNILQEQFNPPAPDQVWCSDITYIWTKEEGFVYLASIMDLFSRKIIAWNLSRSLEVSGIVTMIQQARARRKPSKVLVIHTDRGSQYVSRAYLQATAFMQRSYSKKGYPWDNACIESFHALLKREWLNRFTIKNYQEAYRLVFEYINGFYNTVRIHSHCQYLSPDNYEKQYFKSQKKLQSLLVG